MRWRTTLAALVVAATMAAPSALQGQQHDRAPLLTGTWDLEFAAPWGIVVWTFELEQQGETVTGSSKQGMGTLELQGTLKEHGIEFVVDLKDGPHALTMGFEGTAGADGIGGSVKFEDGSTEKWTFRRAK